jgi:hypothetical protein
MTTFAIPISLRATAISTTFDGFPHICSPGAKFRSDPGTGIMMAGAPDGIDDRGSCLSGASAKPLHNTVVRWSEAMGWEKRRNGVYFYTARRVGGRVVKRYLGADPVAAAADINTGDRWRRGVSPVDRGCMSGPAPG